MLKIAESGPMVATNELGIGLAGADHVRAVLYCAASS
jgi:hypothetical protein